MLWFIDSQTNCVFDITTCPLYTLETNCFLFAEWVNGNIYTSLYIVYIIYKCIPLCRYVWVKSYRLELSAFQIAEIIEIWIFWWTTVFMVRIAKLLAVLNVITSDSCAFERRQHFRTPYSDSHFLFKNQIHKVLLLIWCFFVF